MDIDELISGFISDLLMNYLFYDSYPILADKPVGCDQFFGDIQSYLKLSQQRVRKLTEVYIDEFLSNASSVKEQYKAIQALKKNTKILMRLDKELQTIFPFVKKIRYRNDIIQYYFELLQTIYDAREVYKPDSPLAYRVSKVIPSTKPPTPKPPLPKAPYFVSPPIFYPSPKLQSFSVPIQEPEEEQVSVEEPVEQHFPTKSEKDTDVPELVQEEPEPIQNASEESIQEDTDIHGEYTPVEDIQLLQKPHHSEEVFQDVSPLQVDTAFQEYDTRNKARELGFVNSDILPFEEVEKLVEGYDTPQVNYKKLTRSGLRQLLTRYTTDKIKANLNKGQLLDKVEAVLRQQV